LLPLPPLRLLLLLLLPTWLQLVSVAASRLSLCLLPLILSFVNTVIHELVVTICLLNMVLCTYSTVRGCYVPQLV
jgi:hypothetical protein